MHSKKEIKEITTTKQTKYWGDFFFFTLVLGPGTLLVFLNRCSNSWAQSMLTPRELDQENGLCG